MPLLHYKPFKNVLHDLTDSALVEQDVVIFDIRNIDERYQKYKDDCCITLRGMESCEHPYVDSKGYCSTCGAYHYPLGAEATSLEYFNHIYYIAQSVRAKEVIFITDRDYPADFTIDLFGAVKLKNKFSYTYNKTFISKFGKHWSLKPNRFNSVHVIIFSNKPCKTEDILVSYDFDEQIAVLLESRGGNKIYVGVNDEYPKYFLNKARFCSFDKSLISNDSIKGKVSIFD